jgi:hypothetical protein
MKKRSIIFILFLFIISSGLIYASGNQEIIIEVRTTGDESKLVKTVVENVLRQKGYTITTTNDYSSNTYQKKNNSEMYNINTGPQKGNKLIPSFVISVDADIRYNSSNIYASYNNSNVRPYFEYDGQTLAVLTYQLVSYETDEILNINPNYNSDQPFRGEVFEGTSNEYSFGANSRYGYGDFDLGSNGNIAAYNAVMNAMENGLASRFDAISNNVCNSYYTQTVAGYKPYPPAQPPANYNPNPNSNTTTQQTANYQSPQIQQPTDPNLLSFSTIRNFSKLYAENTLILDTNRDFSVYTDGKLWFEKVADNIQYCNGKSEKSDGNYYQIKIADLKNCQELCVKIGNVKWEFKVNK